MMESPTPPRRKILTRSLSVLLAAGLSGGESGRADEPVNDVFLFSLQQDYQHEDNLFRLPDGIEPLGGGQRDDTVLSSYARARFDKTVSLQQFLIDITAIRNAYQEYDYLDFTAVNGVGRWNWALGSQVQGSISASQSENLRSFADSIGFAQSINTYRRLAADANYWLNSDWSVGVGAIKAASRYNDSASDDAEYDEDGFEAKATYRTITGNQLSLVGAETNGSYPNQRVDAIDGDYRQRDIQLRGDWHLSGVSRIYGYVGFADREYSDLHGRDFSGGVGKLEYDWQLTPKVDINFLARREIGAEADLVDNFVVTEAASIKPTWSVTSRVALSAGMEWLQRTYGGDPGLGVVSSIVKDDLTTIGTLEARYLPLDKLQLSIAWQTESRDSDARLREYDDDILTVSVKFTW